MESPITEKQFSLDEDVSSHLPAIPITPNPQVLGEIVLPHIQKSPLDVAPTPGYPSTSRQWSILLILNLALLIDVVSSSALFVIVSHTAKDLDLQGGDISWILTSYIITFASFQLCAGRLADLTSAGWVFVVGIAGVSILNLILSFMKNAVTFLILRALLGIAAAATIPSSYNITVRTFPEGKQRNRALAVLGLVGSTSFSLGVIIGGLFETISWRWLFRMISIIAGITALLASFHVPKARTVAQVSWTKIFIQMDLVGLLLSVGAVVLFVVALTSGPEYGWNDARFYIALPFSIVLGVGFAVWEAIGIKEENAMLPASIWRVPLVKPLAFLQLTPFVFWATTSFGFPTYWQQTLSLSSLTSAIRLLPVGIAAILCAGLIQIQPKLLTSNRSRPLIFLSTTLASFACILYVYSQGAGSMNLYWAWLLPAFLIGSAACQFACLANNVSVMATVPSAQAGVAGGLLSVIAQVGNVLGLALQAACLTKSNEEDEGDGIGWEGYAMGYWAIFGWILGSTIVAGFGLMYEQKRARGGINLLAKDEIGSPSRRESDLGADVHAHV